MQSSVIIEKANEWRLRTNYQPPAYIHTFPNPGGITYTTKQSHWIERAKNRYRGRRRLHAARTHQSRARQRRAEATVYWFGFSFQPSRVFPRPQQPFAALFALFRARTYSHSRLGIHAHTRAHTYSHPLEHYRLKEGEETNRAYYTRVVPRLAGWGFWILVRCGFFFFQSTGGNGLNKRVEWMNISSQCNYVCVFMEELSLEQSFLLVGFCSQLQYWFDTERHVFWRKKTMI